MNLKKLPNSILILFSICLLLLGVALVVWLMGNMPGANATADGAQTVLGASGDESVAGAEQSNATDGTDDGARDATVTASTTASTTVSAPVEFNIGLADGLPAQMLTVTMALSPTTVVNAYDPTNTATSGDVALYFDLQEQNAQSTYRYTFAAATRFDTIDPEISRQALDDLWRRPTPVTSTEESNDGKEGAVAVRETADGSLLPYSQVAVLTDTLPLLSTVLGEAGPVVVGYATHRELVEAAWQETPTLVLMPFELLEPRLAVLAIDGQKPIENANKFNEATYPLIGTIYGHVTAEGAAAQRAAEQRLATMPTGNRDSSKLTVIAMTGVTAMVRLTAAEMDKRGFGWPAAVVGPELASADITAISNEVPFVPDCKTDTRMDNLTFCSKPEYMEALTDSGVDIIGLTGNHQNDFGRTDAITSLDIYDAAGLPVYGGGRNKEEAFAPLYLEHNGNRLAFLGANSYGPQFAWATDDEPGSAEFDLNIMSATIRSIKELGRADVVLAELQYQESYDVVPLVDQRQNFNALVRAGADIVTGVQSHVPQAMEFTDGKLILYGLGNLYFDQMWSQTTREGLIVKHTIYQNRHISTQVFTTLLYDYGQPQWTTSEENRAILNRVFGVSYW
ncbi:MAG TPA: CapA family protein [Caldilineaceae bacterium]|nr:CapA family protein [Caldilineaceae bacterium]